MENEMSKWQPIETAPKDGRAFLVIDLFNQQWICVKQDDGRIIGIGQKVIALAERIARDATHWMMLPEPPK